MEELTLRKQGSPVLTKKALEVEQGRNVKPLIDEMRRIMLQGDIRGPGIGLAANQVGVLLWVITMAVGGFHKNVINPVITRKLGEKVSSKEGCLSYPLLGEVMRVRHPQIVVEGFDADWNPVRYKLKNLAARAVQHEIDHLDGITIAGDQK